MILIGFFSILLLSNVITALSSFFLARDLDLLVGAPVDWLKLYAAKLLETGVNSSWMVVLMAVPMFAAFGSAYHGGWLFPLLVIGVFVPFLVVPAVIGSALTLILVNVFPARRTRDILSVIAVLAAGGVVLLFRIVRPERLARPEGFRSLVEFVDVLRTPTSPFLPSEWVQRAMLGWLQERPDLLPRLPAVDDGGGGVRARRAAASRALRRSASARRRRAASAGRASGAIGPRSGTRCFSPLGILRRELVLKELRLFFRDTTQWSQLILLAVLVVVYVFNIKYLPLQRRGHHVLPRERHPVPQSRARGLRARVGRGAVHLPERVARRTHALAAASRARCRCASCCGRSSGSARLPLLVLALGHRRRHRTGCFR